MAIAESEGDSEGNSGAIAVLAPVSKTNCWWLTLATAILYGFSTLNGADEVSKALYLADLQQQETTDIELELRKKYTNKCSLHKKKTISQYSSVIRTDKMQSSRVDENSMSLCRQIVWPSRLSVDIHSYRKLLQTPRRHD